MEGNEQLASEKDREIERKKGKQLNKLVTNYIEISYHPSEKRPFPLLFQRSLWYSQEKQEGEQDDR